MVVEIVKAVILAAGTGTRLRASTGTKPKCLIPVNGIPLLELWLRECERAGIGRVLINTHYQAEMVERFIAQRRGVSVELSYEPELLGSAGTLTANKRFFAGEESFVVLYADNLTTFSIRRLTAFHSRHDRIATVGLFRSADPSACGVVALDGSQVVTGFWEKPERPQSNLCNAGLYVFRQGIQEYLPDFVPADIGRDLLPRLAGKAMGFEIPDFFIDIGTPENYLRGQEEYLRATSHAP